MFCSMLFIELDPLAMRKHTFCSLGANISLEMMAYTKIEDKQFCGHGEHAQGQRGQFQAERAACKKVQS